jgi:hypothetical protein
LSESGFAQPIEEMLSVRGVLVSGGAFPSVDGEAGLDPRTSAAAALALALSPDCAYAAASQRWPMRKMDMRAAAGLTRRIA